MHIIISYAKPPGPQCESALRSAALPRLQAFLQQSSATKSIRLDETTLTPPGELLHAQCIGLPAQDGLVPWAAWQALQIGLPQATGTGWAQLSLCHWQINADHVAMQEPGSLQVTPDESRTLMDAMREFFAEDGITLHPGPDGTWLAQGGLFSELPTASLERACGNKVDAWLPRHAQAKPLRRLQNEMQMLLYTHPVNDARAARGLPTINAFWASATGALPASATGLQAPQARLPSCPKALQSAALQDDPKAWHQAWQSLDSGPIAELLALASQPQESAQGELALTLCGDNAAQTFALQPRSAWTRLKRRFATPDIPSLLKSL